MKSLFIASAALAASLSLVLPARAADESRIDAYVTPYYNSSGPVVDAGKFSQGLASENPQQFVSTIVRMKKQFATLNFVELYVGAIRLYDYGYRNEATYWFYSAQFRGRQFAALVDKGRMGSIGNRAFELYHAQEAFFSLAGTNINGYAFGNVDRLEGIVADVARANQQVPDISAMYPGVAFIDRTKWQQQNAAIAGGLASFGDYLAKQKDSIAQQRAQNGTQARFGRLTSKPFPGGF
jgi:hypothetical protein